MHRKYSLEKRERALQMLADRFGVELICRVLRPVVQDLLIARGRR